MAKILIIDDNAANRKVMATLLEHEGHETVEACDGADGLAAVRSQHPQLVMSDILMPTMDGYEFVRLLRAEPDAGETPVIFHTAHYHEREARNLARICQVDRVIPKPANAAEILSAVRQVLSEKPALHPGHIDVEFDREHLRLVTNKLSARENELCAANARLAALTELNVQLASERDPHVLLAKVCRAARELIGSRYAVLAVGDPRNSDSPQLVASGLDVGIDGRAPPRLDAGALGAVFSRRSTLRVCGSDGFVSDIGLPEGYPPAHAFLAAPLCSLTRTYGWICLADKVGATAFSSEEEQVLTTLGAQVGRIYENGVLYRELEEKIDRLNYLACYDELTGIPNRTFFTGCLCVHINNAARDMRKLALVVARIARFESIAETLGMSAADQLIREAAERFKCSIGDPDTIARVGPGEFATLISDVEDEAEVVHALERWWSPWLSTAFRIDGTEVRLDANAGIALFPTDGSDADSLLKHAEAALKRARATADRYLFYTQHLSERGAGKLALESRLRKALESEEFLLHYQPKVDLETRRLTGVEALIRWRDTDQELVPPGEFIPLMEETGIIIDVGTWVLRQASLDYARWLELGFKAPRIAVNVSTVQLRRNDFVRVVNNVIRDTGRDAGIDIEVTESLIMQDAADNIAKLIALRDLGVHIAIDDFGTGYSCLGYLAKLPAAVLKIDRSFIISMLDDPSTMTLVSTIISLAHALRLEVVAEGVESEEQAKILRLVRCDQMQGYLISRPLPFEDMTAFLGQNAH